jgi:hypothetical protein
MFFKHVSHNNDNKTDHHDIAEILLKVALNTINQNPLDNESGTISLVVIGTDCIGSCKSNYHKITTSTLTPLPNCQDVNLILEVILQFQRCYCITIIIWFLVCYYIIVMWYMLKKQIQSLTSRHERASNSTLVVIGTDCIGSCKSNYHKITTSTLPYLINSDKIKTQSQVFFLSDKNGVVASELSFK